MHIVKIVTKGVDKKCVKTGKQVLPPPFVEERLKVKFKEFDTNHDDRLSRKELEAAFNSLGAYVPCWRAGQALRHADQNKDGYINDNELDFLVKYAVSLGYTVE